MNAYGVQPLDWGLGLRPSLLFFLAAAGGFQMKRNRALEVNDLRHEIIK